LNIRRISKAETLGYCHGCHSRAAVEITISSLRPELRLCERDAWHLIEKLTARLNNGNGNGSKNKLKIAPTGG
jgi:hypothetical protein